MPAGKACGRLHRSQELCPRPTPWLSPAGPVGSPGVLSVAHPALLRSARKELVTFRTRCHETGNTVNKSSPLCVSPCVRR